MKNRNGIPILDRAGWSGSSGSSGLSGSTKETTQTEETKHTSIACAPPPPAQMLVKRDSPIVCATLGCRLPGVYPRADGPCCPDCLSAVLVMEHRDETRGVKYLYDEAKA